MSKPLKDLMTETLRCSYEGVNSVCVVDITKLDAISNGNLRSDLLKSNVEMHVVKNSLAARAFKGTVLEPLGVALEGSCALVTGGDSIVDVAKMLVDAAKANDKLQLKMAIVEGDADIITVEQLSKMKSKADLLGEIAMLATSPGRSIAGCLSSPQSKIAGCLKSIAEKEAA